MICWQKCRTDAKRFFLKKKQMMFAPQSQRVSHFSTYFLGLLFLYINVDTHIFWVQSYETRMEQILHLNGQVVVVDFRCQAKEPSTSTQLCWIFRSLVAKSLISRLNDIDRWWWTIHQISRRSVGILMMAIVGWVVLMQYERLILMDTW